MRTMPLPEAPISDMDYTVPSAGLFQRLDPLPPTVGATFRSHADGAAVIMV
jgi:hypothetical protein